MEPSNRVKQHFFGEESYELSCRLAKICGQVRSRVLDRASTMVDPNRSVEQTIALTNELATKGFRELEEELKSVGTGDFEIVVSMVLEGQRWHFRVGIDCLPVNTQASMGGFPKEIREVLKGERDWEPRDPSLDDDSTFDSDSDLSLGQSGGEDEIPGSESPQRKNLSVDS